jgi:hypothetical protein
MKKRSKSLEKLVKELPSEFQRSEGFCGVSPGKAKKESPRQADVGLGRSTGGSARSIHFDGTSAQNLKVEDGRRMTKGGRTW